MLNQFLSAVYSEELYAGISEADYNEVMQASAVDDGWQGYSKWSEEFERKAWHGSKEFNGILIKKACEHTSYPHPRCSKAVQIGGVEI